MLAYSYEDLTLDFQDKLLIYFNIPSFMVLLLHVSVPLGRFFGGGIL